MSYIQLNQDGTFLREITSGMNVVWDENNYCTVEHLVKDGKAAQFNVVPVVEVPQPMIDPMTQAAARDGCEQVGGEWRYKWVVSDLDAETVAANQARKAEQDAATIANKIEQLWSAADKYVNGYISGVAIGILTIGVIQAKPKCLAVTGWSQAIWTEYYARKAGITLTSELDLDFTSFGPIPHSVPELQEEVFAA